MQLLEISVNIEMVDVLVTNEDDYIDKSDSTIVRFF